MSKFHLSSLSLTNFRNYASVKLDLSSHINLITGDNGAGKTSILDAINYLSLGKSAFAANDKEVLKQETDFFRIEGKFHQNEREVKVAIKYHNGRKILELEAIEEKRLKEYIGKFPSVCISPKDILIIIQGSQARRRLIDQTIGQQDKAYLNAIIAYRKVLKQRNELLKQFVKTKERNRSLIEVFNDQLIDHSHIIHQKRIEFVSEFNAIFSDLYDQISENKEQSRISYKSQLLSNDLEYLLNKDWEYDLVSQKTNSGTHKDDLIMNLNGQTLRTFGSQGQQKTFVLSLKLAQFQWLKNHTDKRPMLILDDIYDKLDDKRVGALLKLIRTNWEAQIFISDTDPDRLPKLLKKLNLDFKHYQIENAQLK